MRWGLVPFFTKQLSDVKGISTINVTGANGGFQGYPIPPRMFFVTVGAAL